jgi:8-amino-7-oxononanoate synthase
MEQQKYSNEYSQQISVKESFLSKRLEQRKAENAFRSLRTDNQLVDFCSNDYLGVVRNKLLSCKEDGSGSTGSRLLTGNSKQAESLEKKIAFFHDAEAGLLFTSGFEANTGLLSSVASRGDTIIYDSLSHASIRDGIRLSSAASFSFRHNDTEELQKKLALSTGNVFVVVESVYSMDGDLAPLTDISIACKKYGANLIVDEAHATGIIGEKGEGLVQRLSLQGDCFARIHTFGKACGAMGAIILGSDLLRDFLINFCRNFIYTTAMSPVCLSLIENAYDVFPGMSEEREKLDALILSFRNFSLPYKTVESLTAIQAVLIPGNEEVKNTALMLQDKGFDIRAILYPSVAKGEERLRIVLHAFNTLEEIEKLRLLLVGR